MRRSSAVPPGVWAGVPAAAAAGWTPARLKVAQGRLARITPGLCRDFMRAWTTDWQRWQHHFESLQTGLPRGAALQLLTKQGRPPVRWRTLRRQEQGGATRPEQVADRMKAFASGNASR